MSEPYTLLFGLSANPPTHLGGHAGIVRWAATKERFDELDAPVREVWVLPVYRHAFADKRDMPSFAHRFAMAKLAFLDLPGVPADRVQVRDDERVLCEAQPGERLGTIDLVRYLEAEHPGRRFALLLGEDTYADLKAGRWKASAELRARARVVVVPRVGVDAGVDRIDAPRLTAISSSAVRASTDLAFVEAALRPEVLAYVVRHGLYAFGARD
ncbi:MAG: hypothetical protein RIT81_08660 [Deltaproteobacteria bacterium]